MVGLLDSNSHDVNVDHLQDALLNGNIEAFLFNDRESRAQFDDTVNLRVPLTVEQPLAHFGVHILDKTEPRWRYVVNILPIVKFAALQMPLEINFTV